jgi:hypothetical protein
MANLSHMHTRIKADEIEPAGEPLDLLCYAHGGHFFDDSHCPECQRRPRPGETYHNVMTNEEHIILSEPTNAPEPAPVARGWLCAIHGRHELWRGLDCGKCIDGDGDTIGTRGSEWAAAWVDAPDAPGFVTMGFVTKDSGEREEYPTGARRDTQAGKPRYDLIPIEALTRWAELMARGAEKYGDRNWEKGIPTERFYASALRHLLQWRSGDSTEDHLSAVLFNIGGIIFNEVHGNE